MSALVLIVPGCLDTLTGGYGYDRGIAAGLRDRGWSVDVRELDGSFPDPTSAAREQAARTLAALPDGATVLVDGLALGAMPAEVEREAARLRLVALVHHPLASEVGVEQAAVLRASERRALAAARLVIVTSEATAEALAGYDVRRDRIAVVEPGTDRAPLARGSSGGFIQLLCVATLTPRKGHEVLLRALAQVPDGHWRLTCVGSVRRHPPTVERLRALMLAEGLANRVSLVGEVDASALAGHYDSADLFVLPTLYEGYGMAVAEALARGLPVVGTAAGAIPELIGGGAGIVVPPGDAEKLAAALSEVLTDASTRARLARGARRVRECLPSWPEAARKMAEALERAAGDG